jgi:hypothetical protein
VKHATGAALDQLDDLVVELRGLPQLRERGRGVFYLRSRAFLHFHEDPSGLFADVRLGDDFERHPVTTLEQRRALVDLVSAAVTDR